jgi:hypothetical protein
MASMAAMMGMMGEPKNRRAILANGVTREVHPWDSMQLSKAERKGKTVEEIRRLRLAKWAEANE